MSKDKPQFVWVTRVVSKNEILDFTSAIKNVFGMRLTAYEEMINKGVKEATAELLERYPSVRETKMEITELRNASVVIVAYGVSS